MSVIQGKKERPILFSAPMVNAILSERKTQTRRVAKQHHQVGDKMWVREAWRTLKIYDHLKPSELHPAAPIQYAATDDFGKNEDEVWGQKRPSLFMPRFASRIQLNVVDIKVELLNDISVEDAISEGVDYVGGCDAVQSFKALWETISGEGSWVSNPLVNVVCFERDSVETVLSRVVKNDEKKSTKAKSQSRNSLRRDQVRELDKTMRGRSEAWRTFKPLKSGASKELIGLIESGVIASSKNIARRLIYQHCRHGSYLRNLLEGSSRFSLDDEESGVVSEQEDKSALGLLLSRSLKNEKGSGVRGVVKKSVFIGDLAGIGKINSVQDFKDAERHYDKILLKTKVRLSKVNDKLLSM